MSYKNSDIVYHRIYSDYTNKYDAQNIFLDDKLPGSSSDVHSKEHIFT